MATPTPVAKTWQWGRYGITTWFARWAAADDFTDQVIVDLSGLTTYTNTLQVLYLQMQTSDGISAIVQYDATTDEIIGASIDGHNRFERDYRKAGPGLETGIPNVSTGTTGDVTLTTNSAADGDEVFIYVEWMAT